MTVSYSAPTYTFTASPGSEARARWPVTTPDADGRATIRFTTARRAFKLYIGTTPGLGEIVDGVTFQPGDHVISFIPGAANYYIDFVMSDEGIATLTDFEAVGFGDLVLPTPWPSSAVRGLRSAQSLDVQWWCHRSYQTRVLERRGDDSWSLRKYQPIDGPFEPVNNTPITLTVSQKSGVATMTSSGPLFRTTDIGGLVRLTQSGQLETETFTANGQSSDPIRVTGIGDAREFYFSVTGTFTGTLQLQRSLGSDIGPWANVGSAVTAATTPGVYVGVPDSLDNQIAYYRFLVTAWTSGSAAIELLFSGGTQDGVARIVELSADNSATVDILTPFSSTEPTADWAWGSWSDRFGWPAAVGLNDGRLWFMRDDRYWATMPDDFESMEVSALADGAISRRTSGQGALARWMACSGDIYIGMTDAEGYIGSTNFNDVIKPENVRGMLKGAKGSTNAAALPHEGGAIFISASGRRVYRVERDGDKLKYFDLTRIKDDIAGAEGGNGYLVELACQIEPSPRIWAIRSDGQAALSLFNIEEEINAWQRLTYGTFESVSRTPAGATGTPGVREDDIVFVVNRTLNGVPTKFLERLAPEAWASLPDAWRLACAVRYQGVSATTLTGLDHLEGQEVYVWSGVQQGPFTVASGAITINSAVTDAIIGLLYTGKYRSGRLNWGSMSGSSLTFWKQVKRIGLLVYRTAGGALAWGRNFTDLNRIPDRSAGMPYDSSVREVTEDVNYPFNGSSEPDARVCLIMDKAGPAEVLAARPMMEANDRK